MIRKGKSTVPETTREEEEVILEFMSKLHMFRINADIGVFHKIWPHELNVAEHYWYHYADTYRFDLIAFHRYLNLSDRRILIRWIIVHEPLTA